MLGIVLTKVVVAVKALDLGRHLNGECIRIEVRNRADATGPGTHGRPGGKRRVAERRYGTDAGDCNSLFHLGLLIQAVLRPWFLHRHSAVDAHDLTRNVGSRIARQKAHHAGHFLGARHAPQGNLLLARRAHLIR